MISSVWKKPAAAVSLLLALLVCLSACTSRPSRSELQERLDADVAPSEPAPPDTPAPSMPADQTDSSTPAPADKPVQPEAPSEPAQTDPPVEDPPVDDGMPSDEDLRRLLTDMEIVFTGAHTFTFRSAAELTNEELYLSFLRCTPYDTLLQCWDEGLQSFCFPEDFIAARLSDIYRDFYFDIRQNPLYNDVARAIVTPMASGFGGGRNLVIEDKTLDGDILTVTAAFYPMDETAYEPENCQLRKVYQLELYDGGQRFVSAVEQPLDACSDPETAALLLTMLRRAQIINYPGDESELLAYTQQVEYLAAYDALLQYLTDHAGDYTAYAQAADGYIYFCWFEDGMACVLYAAQAGETQLFYRPSSGVQPVSGLSLPS